MWGKVERVGLLLRGVDTVVEAVLAVVEAVLAFE